MDKKPQIVAKEGKVEFISNCLKEANGVIIADYRGLSVSEVTELRANLRKSGITYKVEKNTLIKKACNANGITEFDQYLEGPTAIAFSEEPVALAKAMVDFSKDHSNLEMKACLCEGNFLDAEGIQALAKTPSREVLLGKMLGSMQSSLTGFVFAVQALIEKLEAGEPAAEAATEEAATETVEA